MTKQNYEGGFVLLKSPLIRSGMHQHTAALSDPVSRLDMDAVNTIQATAWRINTRILDTQRRAFTERLAIAKVPIEKPVSPVVGETYEQWRASLYEGGKRRKHFTDEVWESMDEDARKAFRVKMAETMAENASIISRQKSFLEALNVAEELRNESAIYFPHSRCFRGRVYPTISSGPSPQGTDSNKSLIHFADGKALGWTGYKWLLIRLAGCAGKDKMTLAERVQWTTEHKEQIIQSAKDPLNNHWWASKDFDEPWGCLATCFELASAWELEDPTTFVSHLPVPLDGTCNGLQHLSAMALDPVGAAATNLGTAKERKDIYMDVAAIVKEQVLADILKGNEIATGWLAAFSDPSVARKVVKRAVMTTPYGVTDRGIRDQIIGAGFVKDFEEGKGEAANYIKDAITAALSQVSGPAREIMAWLRTVASQLAKAEQPFDWITPSGSTVRQAYYTTSSIRAVTLVGRVQLWNENTKATLNASKQGAGAPPNYIHSFDAAHLALTVKGCAEVGIKSFAMIHDSFGTHACDTGVMARLLRETFVGIYRKDWLSELYLSLCDKFPAIEFPVPPQRGDFDINEVLESEFFFS